jgi:hypothetical protein
VSDQVGLLTRLGMAWPVFNMAAERDPTGSATAIIM